MKIVLDAGHGGKDPGAKTFLTVEKDMALNIALQVREYLKRNHEVIMTRQTDEYVSLAERCRIANEAKADIFVSIHLNAHDDPRVNGIETFSFPGSQKGGALRNAIHRGVMQLLPGWTDRGTKEANFQVLRQTKMPAALVECGFITNQRDEQRIHDINVRDTFARGIANGVEAYLREEAR